MAGNARWLAAVPCRKPARPVGPTWACGRRGSATWRAITALRALPELALPVPEVAPIRLRVPPHQAGMSTLEAIAHALRLLEGPEVAAPLLALYDELVRRVDRHRGRQRDADGNAVS
jgi:DTW domain-containing protein